MIDKTSEEWKKIPIWTKIFLCTTNNRPVAVRTVLLSGALAAGSLIFAAHKLIGVLALILVFFYAGAIQTVDDADLWGSKADK